MVLRIKFKTVFKLAHRRVEEKTEFLAKPMVGPLVDGFAQKPADIANGQKLSASPLQCSKPSYICIVTLMGQDWNSKRNKWSPK